MDTNKQPARKKAEMVGLIILVRSKEPMFNPELNTATATG